MTFLAQESLNFSQFTLQAAGSAGAISAPMAIRVALPGSGCFVWSAIETLGTLCMVNASPSDSSCVWWRAWPAGLVAHGAECSRWTPIRCSGGWWREGETSCGPFPTRSARRAGLGLSIRSIRCWWAAAGRSIPPWLRGCTWTFVSAGHGRTAGQHAVQGRGQLTAALAGSRASPRQ